MGGNRAPEDAAEQDAHERYHKRVGEVEPPAGQEAELGPEAAGDVGVHAARRRQVPGQLPDGQRRAQAACQGDHHPGRQRPAREQRADGDREGRARGGRHRGDRREDHVGQPDGVAAESLGRAFSDLFGSHTAPSPYGGAADATAGLRRAQPPPCPVVSRGVGVGLLCRPLGRSIGLASPGVKTTPDVAVTFPAGRGAGYRCGRAAAAILIRSVRVSSMCAAT